MQSNKLYLKETITESRVIEKEIFLPYYGFNGDEYYFVRANRTIRANITEGHERISTVATWLITSDIAKATQITEQDFKTAYYTALEALNIDEREEIPVEEDENVAIDRMLEEKIFSHQSDAA